MAIQIIPEDGEDSTDFKVLGMEEPQSSIWLAIGNHSINIIRTDEGVVVYMYKRFSEHDEALGSTYVFDSEVTGCASGECSNDDHDGPCVEQVAE